MRNPAAFRPAETEFNSFTLKLRSQLLDFDPVVVVLRNGRICLLEWDFEDGYGKFRCYADGVSLYWNNDGTSITSDDFDIISDVE